jgi:hypothetical protein
VGRRVGAPGHGPAGLLLALAFGLWIYSLVVALRQGEPTRFDTVAHDVVAEIIQGNFAAVRSRFDPTMAAQLSEDHLANAWRTFQELLGDFQAADLPAAVLRGDLTVEQVPVHLARRQRDPHHPAPRRYHRRAFFLRLGVPVP